MSHEHLSAPSPDLFDPLPEEKAATWAKFGRWETTFFPSYVGLEVEEVRIGYCRMRLPYRSELNQPAGVVHGGAIATLVDTVVVPAIASAYDERPLMLTLSMNVDYLSALRQQDAIGEGWVTRRGRSVVFCEALVRSESGDPVATASLVYKISFTRP